MNSTHLILYACLGCSVAVVCLIMQVKKNLLAQMKTRLETERKILSDNFFSTTLKTQQIVHESLSHYQHQAREQSENNTHRLKIQLTETLTDLHIQIKDSLTRTQEALSNQFEKLNHTTEERLRLVAEKVEDKLAQGFEKTSQTFTDIVKRLALIDDAQKKIHELSTNVINLQEILQDKRSRGVFGEIQLKHLLENALPPNAYALQYTLSNQARVDCMLLLPEPTGKIGIDAKFPLDNFKILVDHNAPEMDRKKAQAAFRQDIKKHILDIHIKYIIPGETSDGAMMFIPAEAVFAEIHANFPDLVEMAHQHRVWLTSPNTMMAILTTASAVLKDSATRKQIHIIQKHLKDLALDFTRFEKRMDNLAKHLQQVNVDADQVHTSAKKIASRFAKIEKVELTHEEEILDAPLLESVEE